MGKEGIGVGSFQALFQKLDWFEQPASYPPGKENPQLVFFLSRVTSSLAFLYSRLALAILSSVLLMELCSTLTLAQVITKITPDRSMGTHVPTGCELCNITGGSRPGNGGNLFHSFQEFNVGSSGIANFMNDTALPTSNILSRVTGGNSSNIFGTIKTEGFENANLFLMNPAGIVFGPNASLNVGGSTHFTTADYLKFGDGIRFTALPSAQDALLSVAPVAAFGFLESSPTSILVKGSTLSVEEGAALSLVGGDIEISSGTLRAPDGPINLVSVTSSGTVSLGEGADIQVNATQLGQIGLSDNAAVNVDGEVGGQVIIRSGQLTIDNGVISANAMGLSEGQSAGGRPTKAGINIQVTEDMLLDNSSIETNVFGGSSNGGDIVLNVGGNLELRGGSINFDLPFESFSGIKTFSFDGSGNAGNIGVNADKIFVNGEWLGMFSATTFSTGNSGNIRLQTNELEMAGGSFVPVFITTLTSGEGQGGDVAINISDGNTSLDNAQITATTSRSGNGGDVIVEAKNLNMMNGSIIQTGTGALGNAGETSLLLSGNLDIRSGSFIGSLVGVNCMEPCGAAGDLKVEANDITIQGVQNAVNPLSSPEFTGIRTRSVAELGGNVNISGNNLFISDNGVIRSASIGSERAGDITVSLKENLELNNKGQFLATAEGSGNAGDITVLAKNINLAEDSSIKAESTSTGNAGNIQLKADDSILVSDSIITTQAENAFGGNIKLTANNQIKLTDSQATSRVQEGSGSAGSINLDPDFIVLKNSEILSTAEFGDGGPIKLTANSAILIDQFSTLDASSQFGGSGTIDIRAPIQFLSGTIAPLPQNPAPVTALYGTRCVAGEGGHFSTFVESKTDSLAPMPGTFLASPFLPLSSVSHTGSVNHTETSSAIPEKVHATPLQLAAYSPPVLFSQNDDVSSACP